MADSLPRGNSLAPSFAHWHSLQFATGILGAATTLTNTISGLLIAILALAGAYVCLHLNRQGRLAVQSLSHLANGIALIGLIAFGGLVVSTNLLLALLALLLAAQLAINLTAQQSKHYIGIGSGFVALMIGASESSSSAYLMIFAAYTLFVGLLLPQLWVIQVDEADTAQSAETPERQKISTNKARITPAKTNLASLRAIAAVLALALFIYLFIPMLPQGNVGSRYSNGPQLIHSTDWQNQADRQQGQQRPDSTGQNDQPYTTNTPNQKEQLAQDFAEGPKELWESAQNGQDEFDYPGFRSDFSLKDAAASRQGELDLNAIVALMKAPHGSYLKVRNFNHFDGEQWSTTGKQFLKLKTDMQGMVDISDQSALPADMDSRPFEQQITIKYSLGPWLAAAESVQSLWVNATAISLDRFNHPTTPEPLAAGSVYTVVSKQAYWQGRLVSGIPAPDQHDLQLPLNFDKRIHDLAVEVTSRSEAPLQKAELLEQHLRQHYQYDFESITRSQGRTPLSTFLFDYKSGHCEYFASAMVVMLRSMGIPARMATGFSANTRNPITGYFEIRAIDGHAWVEAWVNGRWLSFEPTPFYNLPQQSTEAHDATESNAGRIDQYLQQRQQQRQASQPDSSFDLASLLYHAWQFIYLVLLMPLEYVIAGVLALWPVWLLLALMAVPGWHWRQRWLPKVIVAVVKFWLEKRQAQDDRAELKRIQRTLETACRLLDISNRQQVLGRKHGETLENWSNKLVQQTPEQQPNISQLLQAFNQCWYDDRANSPDSAIGRESLHQQTMAVITALAGQQKNQKSG